ncbi:MAG: type II toxin-antitoxin system RelE/ParE family toxin [Thermoleophilia bacterium]|nr:type II toxin-antitoxin system RelE/ParE family toxin [Thermoleophilia bacterium]
MVVYKLRFKRSVAKDLRAIPRKDLSRILRRIRSLASDPRPSGCEKLSGAERYRLRQGVHRIIYTINDEEVCVLVVKVAHRKDAYRG